MYALIFFVIFITTSLNLFSIQQNAQLENDLMEKHLHLINDIITRSPKAIKFSEADKTYLYSNRLDFDDKGYYILLDNGDIVSTNLLFTDNQGTFLPKTSHFFEKKPFKCICNSCKYEWEGGVFTTRCPQCRSKDISTNIPNW